MPYQGNNLKLNREFICSMRISRRRRTISRYFDSAFLCEKLSVLCGESGDFDAEDAKVKIRGGTQSYYAASGVGRKLLFSFDSINCTEHGQR
jgi:hypothetical protein